MRLRKEKSISIVYDAVSISKDIEVIGGPLTLNFYVESGSFVPNRFLTPLVLKPIIYVVDPNNLIPEGDKSNELVKCNWYENGEKIISGDDYKINKDNSLTVLKNSTRDLTISFSATWLDPRKKQEITIEESVDLVCVQLAGDTSNPVLKLDKPLNWIHNPLKNDRIYTIKAYISKDKIYEGAVEWYYSTKGKEPKLIDNTLLAYEGGQYTNELKLNSAYLENCLITAKNLSNDKLKEYYWFFDENGNPLTYDEPQYKDIEGSNYFEFPEEALTTRAKVRLEGLTLTNLVKNGDFREGLKGWTIGGDKNSSLNDGVLTLVGDTTAFTNNRSHPKGEKLFVCFEFYLEKDTDTIQVIYNQGPILKYTGKKGWNKYSGFIQNEGNSFNPKFSRGNSDVESFKITNFMAFNLTQAFGAGNEPTKEWCDEHIQGYFEGTKSVTAPLRIRSVGENLLLNGNGEFGLEGWIPRGKPTEIKNLEGGGFSYKRTSGGSRDGIMTPVYLPKGSYWIRAKGVSQSSYASQEFSLVYYDDGKIKHYKTVLKTNHSSLGKAEFKVDVSRTYYLLNDNMGDTNSIQAFKEVSITSSKVDSYLTSLRPHLSYITNEVNLSRVGKVFDYIEDGKLYKNIKKLNNIVLASRQPKDTPNGLARYCLVVGDADLNNFGDKDEVVVICNKLNFIKKSSMTESTEDIEGVTTSYDTTNSLYIYINLKKSIDFEEFMKDCEIYYISKDIKTFNISTTGNLTTHPNGSVFIDYVTKTSSYYIKDKGFKFEGDSSKIVSLRSGSGNNYYDVSKIKKAGDNLYTHPDIKEDTILTIEYETGPSIYGNNTVSYMSIKEVLDELWLEDVYTYKGVEDSEGNITWEFVRLVDIDNYEEWLTQDKISPYTLAPDGIIFGKYKADTKFLRQFPSSLYVDIIIPNRLKDGSGKVKARALVGTADGIIENPERYFKITWLRRDIKAGSKDEVIGYGEEILLDIDERSSISIDVEDLGVFKALTDEKGKYLTDENNTILVGR